MLESLKKAKPLFVNKVRGGEAHLNGDGRLVVCSRGEDL